MFWIELVVVLAMIVIGARYGGLGLGMMGGLGVAILSFLTGDLPSDPPVEVILMIAAVVTAARAPCRPPAAWTTWWTWPRRRSASTRRPSP